MEENKQSNLKYSLFCALAGQYIKPDEFSGYIQYMHLLYIYTRSEAKERGIEEVKKRSRLLCRWFRFAQLAKGKKSRP